MSIVDDEFFWIQDIHTESDVVENFSDDVEFIDDHADDTFTVFDV